LSVLKISVVVVVCNGEATLAQCLDSIRLVDYPQEDIEIVVVDNNSTDKTKDIILGYPVKYVFVKERGRARARNAGIRAASGELIAFTDADCVVDRDWLKELIKGFESDRVAACGGRIIAQETGNWIQKFIEETGIFLQKDIQRKDCETNLFTIVTANSIFKKKVLEKIGYFDENLVTCEDTEMGYRISLCGYQIKYMPQSIVYHYHIKNLGKFCAWSFNFGYNSYIYLRKYRVLFNSPSNLEYFLQAVFILFVLIKRYIYGFIKLNGNIKFVLLSAINQTFFKLGGICSWIQDKNKWRENITKDNPLHNLVIKEKIEIKYKDLRWEVSKFIFGLPCRDSFILYNSSNNDYYRLNQIATLMYKSLTEGRDGAYVIHEFSQMYNIAHEIIDRDLASLLRDLEKQNIILRQ
jgi:GT2 family glycosyltransferase